MNTRQSTLKLSSFSCGFTIQLTLNLFEMYVSREEKNQRKFQPGKLESVSQNVGVGKDAGEGKSFFPALPPIFLELGMEIVTDSVRNCLREDEQRLRRNRGCEATFSQYFVEIYDIPKFKGCHPPQNNLCYYKSLNSTQNQKNA